MPFGQRDLVPGAAGRDAQADQLTAVERRRGEIVGGAHPKILTEHTVTTKPGRPSLSRLARLTRDAILRMGRRGADTACMGDRNVLGGELEPCGTDPLTGFYRDGCCTTGPEDLGSHTICAVVTTEFLEHQRRIGNDLSTPMPQFRFPGLVPGDRWCVTAANWLQAHRDGAAAPVVLASTHQRALEIVPLEILRRYSVDVPADAAALDE